MIYQHYEKSIINLGLHYANAPCYIIVQNNR